MKTRGEIAKENFLRGHNCAQAVLLAFEDVTGLPRDVAMRLSSSFGGGMGRMREVCGSVSAAMMVLGLVYGYDAESSTEKEDKAAHYARVQALAGRFREERGSIVCREILASRSIPNEAGGEAEARTPEYYHKRPCAELVYIAAETVGEMLAEKGILN